VCAKMDHEGSAAIIGQSAGHFKRNVVCPSAHRDKKIEVMTPEAIEYIIFLIE